MKTATVKKPKQGAAEAEAEGRRLEDLLGKRFQAVDDALRDRLADLRSDGEHQLRDGAQVVEDPGPNRHVEVSLRLGLGRIEFGPV